MKTPIRKEQIIRDLCNIAMVDSLKRATEEAGGTFTYDHNETVGSLIDRLAVNNVRFCCAIGQYKQIELRVTDEIVALINRYKEAP
jgi:phage gp36-like protein